MVLTRGSLASDGVEAVVDHHQAVVLPGLSHPTQLPPSEGRRGRDSGKCQTRGREVLVVFLKDAYSYVAVLRDRTQNLFTSLSYSAQKLITFSL